MAAKIVFVGNEQLRALRDLYDSFVAGHTGCQTSYLPAAQLDAADLGDVTLLVEQVDHAGAPDRLPRVARCCVPLVSGAFLWPYAGEQHPANTDHPHLRGGPYPAERGDRFLNRLLEQGLPVEASGRVDPVAFYRDYAFAPGELERGFQAAMQQQRRRDAQCGFALAEQIEEWFRTEPLFLTPHGLELRLMRTLAEQCFRLMGVPLACLERLASDLRRTPMSREALPIHPAVAAQFRLAYVTADTRYFVLGERRSWEQWASAYLDYAWEPDIYDAAAIRQAAPDRARELLRGALQRRPNSWIGRHALAEALLHSGDLDGAAQAVSTVLELDPGEPEGWELACRIAMRRGLRDDAGQFADRAVDLDPTALSALQLAIQAHTDNRNFPRVEYACRKRIETAPHNSHFQTEFGTSLLHQYGRADGALVAYERAITLDATNAGPHFGASLALAQLGRLDEATVAVRAAIDCNPSVPQYHSHLGHLLARIGDAAGAVTALRGALRLEPGNAGIHAMIAGLLSVDAHPYEVLAHRQQAAALSPGTVDFQLALSDLLVRLGRPRDAIAPLRQAVSLRPDDAGLAQRLAELCQTVAGDDGHLAWTDRTPPAEAEPATTIGQPVHLPPRTDGPADGEQPVPPSGGRHDAAPEAAPNVSEPGTASPKAQDGPAPTAATTASDVVYPPAFSANLTDDELLAHAAAHAGIATAALALKFDSFGDDCEFGMVQRFCGADPLGLFRFSNPSPAVLVRAIDSDFAGFGDAAIVRLEGEAPKREWMVVDPPNGLRQHTHIWEGSTSEELVTQQQLRRSRFLRRKMVEDIACGNKIFVMKSSAGALSRTMVETVRQSLRKKGPAWLLWVETGQRVGQVEVLADGLALAIIDRLTVQPDAAKFSHPGWLAVLAEAWRQIEPRLPADSPLRQAPAA